MPKNKISLITFEIYLEIVELAKKHGKKSGDSMQEEFDEILKKYPNEIKELGTTDMGVDLLTGNLRENGKKVLNLKEEDRRKENGRK